MCRYLHGSSEPPSVGAVHVISTLGISSHVVHASFEASSTGSEVVGGFGRSQLSRVGGLGGPDSREEQRGHF